MSTSPDSSAATRVGSDLTGVWITSVTLLVALSHQSLFCTMVMRWSGVQPVILYEPVPLTLREA